MYFSCVLRRSTAGLFQGCNASYLALRANDNHLVLMRPIDELFTAWPFLGLRRMTALLKAEGCALNQHMTTAHVMLTRRTVISNPLE
jgi:hypothetical protein